MLAICLLMRTAVTRASTLAGMRAPICSRLLAPKVFNNAARNCSRIPTKFEMQSFFSKVDASRRVVHRLNALRDAYHLVAQLLTVSIPPLDRVLFHWRDRVVRIDVAIRTLYEKALDTSTKGLFHHTIGNAWIVGRILELI